MPEISKSKGRREGIKSKRDNAAVFKWMAGTSAPKRSEFPQRESGQDSLFTGDDKELPRPSTEDRRQRMDFLKQDPLNVHQRILKHLQGEARTAITSVYDLASIITESCVGLFDPYQVSDEFQFFDFFERCIGDVVRKPNNDYARDSTS